MSFDRFSQRATEFVVSPWFFFLVLAAILAWMPTLFLADMNRSDLIIDALCNPASLLLLVLLQNSQTRQEKALDMRQDEVARALALLLDHSADHEQESDSRRLLQRAAQDLRANAERTERLASGE